MLSDRRARQKAQEQERRAKGPQVREVGEPGQGNRFVFDLSQLDGEDGLDGGGAFTLDHSKFDHLDRLSAERPPNPTFRFDFHQLDGEAVLS